MMTKPSSLFSPAPQHPRLIAILFLAAWPVLLAAAPPAPSTSNSTKPGDVMYIEPAKVWNVVSTPTAYGQMITGELSYACRLPQATAWAWLEVSFDDGRTWSAGKVQAVGHVGTIPTGDDRQVKFLIDARKGESHKLRIRVNPSAPVYHLNKTNALKITTDGPAECPKPIPEDGPYPTLELLLNKEEHQHDLSLANPKVPAKLPIAELGADVGTGKGLLVGFGDSPLPTANQPRANPKMKIRATYLRVGEMEFAVISKNSIRNTVEVVNQEKEAIEKATGIPRHHIMHNWCHEHYSDNGELAINETLSALKKAKEGAKAGKMASIILNVGVGFNYRRSGQSGRDVFTDGPIDDQLAAMLFTDTDGKPIGSWIRFTGHIAHAPELTAEMEKRWGGICAFLNGNGGNVNTTGNYVKEGGKYTPAAIVDMVLKEAPSAKPKDITKLGVSWTSRKYYSIETLMQCLRLGDFLFPAYYAEPPVEQALVTRALLGPQRTIVIGYANGRAGPGGGYYNWNTETGIPRWQVYEMTQLTVRCANVLDLLLD